MDVQIRYTVQLPALHGGDPDEMRDHELTLDCYLNHPERDVGWLGSLDDYDVVHISPPFTGPVGIIEKAVEANWTEIEEKAFNSCE